MRAVRNRVTDENLMQLVTYHHQAECWISVSVVHEVLLLSSTLRACCNYFIFVNKQQQQKQFLYRVFPRRRNILFVLKNWGYLFSNYDIFLISQEPVILYRVFIFYFLEKNYFILYVNKTNLKLDALPLTVHLATYYLHFAFHVV